jgi:hypothetical protein
LRFPYGYERALKIILGRPQAGNIDQAPGDIIVQLRLAVLLIGVIAMLVAVVFQALLILQIIEFAQTAFIVPLMFGLFGAALMVYGYLSLTGPSLPRGLAALVIIGGLITVIGYPIWAIWFGRLLLSGRLAS